jgi:iron complex transport system substrate-binding protein
LAITVVAVLVVASLAVAIIFLLGPAPATGDEEGTITVVDDRGKSINFTAPPQRIISLGSSFTEIVIALNESSRLVGLDQTSAALPGVPEGVADLGAVSAMSKESLATLEPDCVLIWNFPSYAERIADMEANRLTVVALYPKDVQSTLSTMELIGTMMGSNATALVAGMQARVDAVLDKTADLTDEERTRIYLELGSKNHMGKTVGNGTLSNEIIHLAGGVNIFVNGTGYWIASPEQVVDRNPQVIVVENTSIYDRQHFVETYSGTDAVTDDRIHRLEAGTLTTSPRLVDALEDLARWLHPELFP